MKLHSKSWFAFGAPRAHRLSSYVFVHNYVALFLLLLGLVADECTRSLTRLVLQVRFVSFVANEVWRSLRVLGVGKGTLFSRSYRLFLLLLFLLSLELVERAHKTYLAPLAFLRHLFRTHLQQVDGSTFAFYSKVKSSKWLVFRGSATYRKRRD